MFSFSKWVLNFSFLFFANAAVMRQKDLVTVSKLYSARAHAYNKDSRIFVVHPSEYPQYITYVIISYTT